MILALSSLLSVVLGCLNFVGYMVLTAYLGVTEIPILIADIDKLVKTAEADGESGFQR